MKLRVSVAIAALVASRVSIGQPDNAPAGRWWSHMQVLANDELEGRLTGTQGHRKAVEYAAKQLERAGLKRSGTDGYFQPVQFIRLEIVERGSKLELVRDGKATPLDFADDAFLYPVPDLASTLEAPLMFVGHGLTILEKGIEDLKGLDLKGKVAVSLAGAPVSLPGPLGAYAQSIAERWKALKKAGALGVVRILNPDNMDIPWPRLANSRTEPDFTLADPSLNETAGLQLAVVVNPAQAEKWFADSGHTFAEIIAAARQDKPLPKFEMAGKLRVATRQSSQAVTSDNVVAVLPGSDPRLKDEYVVVSAHIDHLGLGSPVDGDRIYNGAFDNASGCSTVLETAATLAHGRERPRRSIVFLLPTGEEQGTLLLGSKYFVNRPTVPVEAIVADVNIDNLVALFPLKSLIAIGMDESDLGNDVRAVGAKLGLEILPDPQPKRVLFIRSDQYSFVRRGIPAVWPRVGFRAGSPEEVMYKKWLTERYHAPSDDLQQPINRQTAEDFNRAFAALVLQIANRDRRPAWNESSFFRRFVK